MELMTNERFQSWMKYIRALLFITLILSFSFFLVIGGIYYYAKSQEAPPLWVTQSSIFYAADQSIIGEAYNGEKRYWVPLDEISPHLIDATIAVEDRRFFSHHGFDYRRIVGAIIADIKARAKVQGASTITQQYARNLFLEHKKTFSRKLQEALYTIRMEIHYSKEEILEGYLNTIYYGHGAYGIESAAHYYFGKSAIDLNLEEASMLAGIPKGPSIFSPFNNEERALERQQVVLHSMVANGSITAKDVNTILEMPLQYGERKHLPKEYMAPYFQDAVRSVLRNELQLQEELLKGGLHIYTTLDPKVQAIAEKEIAEGLKSEPELQVGFVAMNPNTGQVKALVGGRNYEESPFNRATQAERQPGSTFKPLLYYKALENGFTPSTPFRSEKTTFTFDEGRATYMPKNFNNLYPNSELTMLQALPLSDNVYAVKTHLYLGEDQVADMARLLGVTSQINPVPALALGTSPVKVIDMATAYSVFANGGKSVKPVFIEKVVTFKGEVLFEREKKREQILDKDKTFVLNHMMTGMFDPRLNGYTSVTGNKLVGTVTRPYAGKSGTTETDSWMIGYTPQLVSAVWTGFDDNKPMMRRDQLVKYVWAGFMEKALLNRSVEAFRPTEGVVGVYVNPESGLLATENCPVSRLTYYEAGTEPIEYCHLHNVDEVEVEEGVDTKPVDDGKAGERWWRKLLPWRR